MTCLVFMLRAAEQPHNCDARGGRRRRERPWPHSSPAEERAVAADDVPAHRSIHHVAGSVADGAQHAPVCHVSQACVEHRLAFSLSLRFDGLVGAAPGCSGRVFSPTEAPRPERRFCRVVPALQQYVGYYAPAVRGGVLTAVGALTTERVACHRAPAQRAHRRRLARSVHRSLPTMRAAAFPSARTASDTQPPPHRATFRAARRIDGDDRP